MESSGLARTFGPSSGRVSRLLRVNLRSQEPPGAQQRDYVKQSEPRAEALTLTEINRKQWRP